MKHRYLIFPFSLILFSLTLIGGVQANDQQVSLDDIVLLNQRGLSDQTIQLFLANRELAFSLDAEAIDGLLSKGVSEEIISYLLSRSADEDIVAETTVVVAPNYSRRVYPGYYYTPYFFGASFAFDNYPHSWFGYYAGAGLHQVNAHRGGHVSHGGFYPGKHVNQIGHGATHAVQHTAQHGGSHNSGNHNGGVTHGIVGGLHGAGFSGNNHSGSARPHGATTGGNHGVTHSGQSARHGASRLGHAVTAIGNSHAGAVVGGQSHAGSSGGHSNGGQAHSGGSRRGHSSGGRSGGGHRGGRSGGH